jgi:glutathionylspermidine synthase
MRRHRYEPRPDWPQRVESIGLTYHTHEESPYWDESVAFEFTREEVETLESAAGELHRMCLEAAGKIIENAWWSRLAVPDAAVPTILESWERDDFSIYGRFDLAYDGSGPPKLLEYNADTPTALIEASVAQWFWLQDRHPDADQFNSIHERLIEAWRRWSGSTVHFSGVSEHSEDGQTVLYLRDTAEQAQVPTRGVAIEDIGWDEGRQCFVDLEGLPIERCFKLYPWEWMWTEEFGAHLSREKTRFVEPAWKMLLANKGILPVLWELFPDHPLLLPAFDDPEPLHGRYLRKSRFGREGRNITWYEDGQVLEGTGDDPDDGGFVYQAPTRLAEFEGQRAVLGVWIIDHEPAGLGIREDSRRITGNLSRFIPHFFR